MVQQTPLKLHWKQRLTFHIEQGNHCSTTDDFSYFHASRAYHSSQGIDYAANLRAQGVLQEDLDRLTAINVANVEASENAALEVEKDLKQTKIDENAPEVEKQDTWERGLIKNYDAAKEKVNKAIEAGLQAAIAIIHELPEGSRGTAADFFIVGTDIVMEAFDFMVKKISELFKSVADFIKKIWTPITNMVKAVTDKVSSCVSRLFGLKSTTPISVADDSATMTVGVGDNSGTATPYTGYVLDLAWDLSVIPTTISLTTLYLLQRYRNVESRFDTWFTPIAKGGDGRWHSYFGTTNCNNIEQVVTAMNLLVGIERKRQIPIPDDVWAFVPTPDNFSSKVFAANVTGGKPTPNSKMSNGTVEPRVNGDAVMDEDGASDHDLKAKAPMVHVNRILTLSYDNRIHIARMNDATNSIWNTYVASGGLFLGATLGQPGEPENGRRVTIIKWAHSGHIDLQDTKMENACEAEEYALSLSYRGTPLTHVVGAGAQTNGIQSIKHPSENQ